MSEEDDMNQDREVNVNWLRINVPSVVTIVLAALAISGYVQSLASDLRSAEATRKSDKVLLDKDIDFIKTQLNDVKNVPLRVDLLEKGLASTNQRVDTYLTTLGAKMDGISDRVSSLTTKVEVVDQKIDSLKTEQKTNPSAFRVH